MAGVAKEKRKVKKRGTGCAVRASSSVDALIASSTASATEYYVPSSASASASATASGPYVQNAAVNKSDSSWSSPSSSNAQNRDSSSAAATGSSTVRYAVPASSSTSSSSTSTTTPAPAWTSTSTSSTAPATTSASPGTDWKTGGHATYYYQNGNAGACGEYHADSDPIIAINGAGYWSDYGVKSPYCGKWVTIKNPANGKQVQAKVADVCPTCTGSTNSIDLSVGAFEAIGTLDQGQVDIEWAFNN
ncbi:hypothetical protein QFC19_007334 [Naganishia cerealis]|uniref:Uncharacterized protein n=1 Tax=Naganishia cerealis TaxID=610337 RepID=A0ACC2VAJ4_9TREE|nr:hypothetical protein QFC19_007334 [Naganishia cerealis]